MEQDLESIKATALREIAGASDEDGLESLRVRYLGKEGEISKVSVQMRSLPKEDKPKIGKLLNEVRAAVTESIDRRSGELVARKDAAALAGMDLTLPGTPSHIGRLHPLTQLQDRVTRIFRRMGFVLAEGPDIETEWHCFDALNTPPNHPARNEQDTFFLPDGRLLRTHTSTVQIRVMTHQPPPIRVIGPGAAYRRDEVDATHLAHFHQIEGLFVDRDVSLADLKSSLEFLFCELFGPDTKCRFRPHFFPFTEPSYEIDIQSRVIGAEGKWLELAGCGMVDPAVFEEVNRVRGDSAYDPEIYTGFAFGFGLERLAMILSAVPDIRYFNENDLRFLSQFPL